MKTKNYVRWLSYHYMRPFIGSLLFFFCLIAAMIAIHFVTQNKENYSLNDKIAVYLSFGWLFGLTGIFFTLVVIDISIIKEGISYYISVSNDYVFCKYGSNRESMFFYGQYPTKVKINQIRSIEFEFNNVDSKGREPGCNSRNYIDGNYTSNYFYRRTKKNQYLLIKTCNDEFFRFSLYCYSVRVLNKIIDDIKLRMQLCGNDNYLFVDKSKILETFKKTKKYEEKWEYSTVFGYKEDEENNSK